MVAALFNTTLFKHVPRRPGLVAVVAFSPWLAVSAACACSTCFGDPDSQMVKGAVMGVYVMIGVVSCVLVGFTGAGLFWIRRSRRLTRKDHAAESCENS